MMWKRLALFSTLGVAYAAVTDQAKMDACPGYKATNVKAFGSKLTANLELAGTACNVYGPDINKLKLEVTYETSA